jgi:PhnB protein
MATKSNITVIPKKVRPIPEGYYTVTPFVITRDSAKLLDFVKEAFGAQELGRVYSKDGSIGHAETRIGDSVVMTFDAKDGWPDTPAFLRLYVEDCDATYQQALNSGAAPVTRPTNTPWGDRACRVRDPLGNLWWIHTRIEDLSLKEIEKRWGQKEYIDAMEYVQGAQFFPSDK